MSLTVHEIRILNETLQSKMGELSRVSAELSELLSEVEIYWGDDYVLAPLDVLELVERRAKLRGEVEAMNEVVDREFRELVGDGIVVADGPTVARRLCGKTRTQEACSRSLRARGGIERE